MLHFIADFAVHESCEQKLSRLIFSIYVSEFLIAEKLPLYGGQICLDIFFIIQVNFSRDLAHMIGPELLLVANKLYLALISLIQYL